MMNVRMRRDARGVPRDMSDARAALARFVAQRLPGQTPFGIALHVERLIARKTCPACWRPTGFGMQARHLGQSYAHAVGCEANARVAAYATVRLRADPTLVVLLAAARGDRERCDDVSGDDERWELDPASAEDYEERQREMKEQPPRISAGSAPRSRR